MKHYVNPKYIPENYQQCTKTVMDNIADPNITFDENGICNYYYEYFEAEKEHVFKGEAGRKKLEETIAKIKQDGKGKKYDCIVGVSGGVDSSYMSYMSKQWGLRTLLVHFDNGWNSELSVKNIERIINKLGFDLETYVIEWNEFRDIQRAYFKANVVDIEAITDHAVSGTLSKIAAKHNIKNILAGMNIVSEYILPKDWIFNKNDHVNIKDIHDKYGTLPLKKFPFYNLKAKHYYQRIKGINSITILNYIPYDKDKVMETIQKELGWVYYGGKHYESIFTRFYQGYILPNKFGIDKRKAHLSTLICSGQLTKKEALSELSKPIYPSEEMLNEDKEFVLKKLGFTKQEFDNYINAPRRRHSEFKIEQSLYNTYPILKPLKPIGDFVKKILK